MAWASWPNRQSTAGRGRIRLLSAPEPRREDQRESIWSVTPGFLKLYLLLFGVLFVFGTAYLVYYEIAQSPTGNGHDIAAVIIKSIGSVAIGAAGISFFATELVGGSVVLASYLQRKLLDEPRIARERELAKLNEENARLKEENARLMEENARLFAERRERRIRRRARGQNHDSSNPNQD